MLGAKELHLIPVGRVETGAHHLQNGIAFSPIGVVSLGVDPAVAEQDACRMELSVSAESFAAIKRSHQKKPDPSAK